MSIFSRLRGGSATAPAEAAAKAAAIARGQAWENAFATRGLPEFVETRLKAAGSGGAPWLSTMTAAELLLARSHGLRPLATVSGTCWYQFGASWTEGHEAGWATALARISA